MCCVLATTDIVDRSILVLNGSASKRYLDAADEIQNGDSGFAWAAARGRHGAAGGGRRRAAATDQ
jgi:hypothetical protein